MVKNGNEFKKTEPAIYIDSEGRKIVNLGEIAEICKKNAKDLWATLFDIDRKAYAFAASIAHEDGKHMIYFYLDQGGHVLFLKDDKDDNDTEDSGFNIGGNRDKTVGSWEDIFILNIKCAFKLLDRYRVTPELRLVTWEKVKIHWDGSELHVTAQKEAVSA